MSAGAVFREALKALRGHELPEQGERDVLAAMEAARPGPLAMLYEAGVEAGLERGMLLRRAAGLYFCFCAANLADDMADGDCHYYGEPLRVGPGVQFALHGLFLATVAQEEVPAPVLAEAARDMVAMAGLQAQEVRTHAWRAAVYRRVAEGISGRQWAVYLRVLWAGTPLAGRAAEVGMGLGVTVHVREDILSQDPRFHSMPEADQRAVVAWTREVVENMRREGLRCVDAVMRTVEPVLGEAG